MMQMGIRIAAVLLLLVPVLATGASAQGKPQGKGGGSGPPAGRAGPPARPAPQRAVAPAPRQVAAPLPAPRMAQPAPHGRGQKRARPRGGPSPAATFTRQGGPRPTAFTRHRGG